MAEQLEERRLLATYTVTNAGDGLSQNPLTLRSAIINANSNPGADTIVFSSTAVHGSVPIGGGTVTSEMLITDHVTIDGDGVIVLAPGPHILDANGNSRIFNIDNSSASVIDVTIKNMVLKGGNASDSGGGAINNAENLTLDTVTVDDNSAFLGGGVFSLGSLQVIDSTISANTATGNNGGGIENGGTLLVRNSTLSGNSAGAMGGAINSYAGVGKTAMVTIENTTIANNSAPTASAVSNFGGGTRSLIVSSSILEGSVFNTGFFTSAFSLINQTAQLGPLADNGGPTETHALLSSSPAINAGDPLYAGPMVTDQRGTGFARVLGGRVDMGAYESPALPFPSQGLIVSTTDDVVDTDTSPGNLSLREAISFANETTGAHTITFDSLFDIPHEGSKSCRSCRRLLTT